MTTPRSGRTGLPVTRDMCIFLSVSCFLVLGQIRNERTVYRVQHVMRSAGRTDDRAQEDIDTSYHNVLHVMKRVAVADARSVRIRLHHSDSQATKGTINIVPLNFMR